MASQTIEQLNQKFAIPGAVTFERGAGGLARARVNTVLAEGEMYLHGAHVTQFQARGQEPLLFLGRKSFYQNDKPIRGGVPICFPWFGPRVGDPSSPMHGFARLMEWEVTATRKLDGHRVAIEMTLRDSDSTRTLWPNKFTARYTVTFGATLELSLAVRNDGDQPFKFEEALHTYAAVGDIKHVSLTGLEGVEFMDKVAGTRPREGKDPIRITGETDRVYCDTTSTCVIHDPVLCRAFRIEKEHSRTTVVWNPWDDPPGDLLPEEASKFLCVETVNAREQTLQLQPGTEHIMTARLMAL
ncbi:MAG TPA: D-hexose-6-phosphate mutarotase [Tepidisphaeraceae bacterium]|jgi:glucose-6-phosphate 1-epimerase|nr:D-hexose-6-phosphate mutarotase [Tepidisphaeraceae bacterium]